MLDPESPKSTRSHENEQKVIPPDVVPFTSKELVPSPPENFKEQIAQVLSDYPENLPEAGEVDTTGPGGVAAVQFGPQYSLEIVASHKPSMTTSGALDLSDNADQGLNMNVVDRLRAKLNIGNELYRAALCELFCTGFLLFGGTAVNAQYVLSQRKNNDWIGVSVGWGLVLMFAALMGHRISGAHLNPAVSFFQLTQGKINALRFIVFVVAQNIGAFFGALTTFVVYYDAIDQFDNGTRYVTGPKATAAIFATYPQPHLSTLGAVIDQIVGTALLCLGIAAVTDRRNRIPPFLQPAFIGTLLAFLGMSVALNAGYAINPARDFAPRLFTLCAGYGWRVFSYRSYKWFWVPIICPMIGAVLGAWLYEFFIGFHIPDDPETTYIHKILDDRNPDGQLREVHLIETKPIFYKLSSPDLPLTVGVFFYAYWGGGHTGTESLGRNDGWPACGYPEEPAAPSMSLKRRLSRIGHSFREGAHNVQKTIREEGLARVRKVPAWVRILNKAYHQYGLKHICLLGILVVYLFLGALVFYYFEAEVDYQKEVTWNKTIAQNRTHFVNEVIPLLFNNTKYLFFLSHEQTLEISNQLHQEVMEYEKQLGIKYTDQKIRWDFWNAMLYSQTICTTIGYGHLYPNTNFGRVFTMIYAIFGIPLVLSILDDLGKVLTRILKSPWWLLKCGCRRAFRYCTKQTLEEIQKLDAEDKRDLEIFDLPVPIAIIVVIGWIFFCSATFCIWEHDWDYFVAFYFFFISLSTIGLGDITPTQPKYLLVHFMYIIIGLSLVSMCINLIQAKLERTYEAGGEHRFNDDEFDKKGGLLLEAGGKIKRRGSSLGVFRTSSSAHSLTRETVQAVLSGKRKINKTCQTILSFPSPSSTNASIVKSVNQSRARFVPRSLSIDDVMRMVDSEDGDIVVLTDLVREESGISQSSNVSDASIQSSGSQVVVSRSFDADFRIGINHSDGSKPRLPPSRVSHHDMREMEALEEMEDRIALANSADLVNSVHFRSRLSLIPEQLPSTVEETEEPSEESHPLSTGDESESSRKSSNRSFHLLNYLARKKPDREVSISS